MSTVNISQAVRWQYPDANPLVDFKVDVVNGEQKIVRWGLADPQPTDNDLFNWWIEFLKKDKLEKLSDTCESTICNGFVGTNGHQYQFDYKDQDNLTQQMLFLVNDPTIVSIDWKTKDVGILTHTRDEFLQVCKDADSHKRSNFGKYWTLEAQVKSATTEDEINSIVW